MGSRGDRAVQGSSLGSSLSVVGPEVTTQAVRYHDGRSHDDRRADGGIGRVNENLTSPSPLSRESGDQVGFSVSTDYQRSDPQVSASRDRGLPPLKVPTAVLMLILPLRAGDLKWEFIHHCQGAVTTRL